MELFFDTVFDGTVAMTNGVPYSIPTTGGQCGATAVNENLLIDVNVLNQYVGSTVLPLNSNVGFRVRVHDHRGQLTSDPAHYVRFSGALALHPAGGWFAVDATQLSLIQQARPRSGEHQRAVGADGQAEQVPADEHDDPSHQEC